MDFSEERLDGIESQRSKDVSQDQWRPRYILMNLIDNVYRTLITSQAREEGTTAGYVPDFLTNLILSDLFDVPGEYVTMNLMTYSAVSSGNINFMETLRSYGTPMACLKDDQGDSILHLAAAWGHLELVKTIVSECACLLLESNLKDELPLHVAARAGHSKIVKALVASVTYFSARLSEEEMEKLDLYVVKNRDGDTPLHAALKEYNLVTATSLVEANQQASFLANEKETSPLYMAIEAGYVSLVKAMLKTSGINGGPQGSNSTLNSQLEGRKNLVHIALKAKNIGLFWLFITVFSLFKFRY